MGNITQEQLDIVTLLGGATNEWYVADALLAAARDEMKEEAGDEVTTMANEMQRQFGGAYSAHLSETNGTASEKGFTNFVEDAMIAQFGKTARNRTKDVYDAATHLSNPHFDDAAALAVTLWNNDAQRDALYESLEGHIPQERTSGWKRAGAGVLAGGMAFTMLPGEIPDTIDDLYDDITTGASAADIFGTLGQAFFPEAYADAPTQFGGVTIKSGLRKTSSGREATFILEGEKSLDNICRSGQKLDFDNFDDNSIDYSNGGKRIEGPRANTKKLDRSNPGGAYDQLCVDKPAPVVQRVPAAATGAPIAPTPEECDKGTIKRSGTGYTIDLTKCEDRPATKRKKAKKKRVKRVADPVDTCFRAYGAPRTGTMGIPFTDDEAEKYRGDGNDFKGPKIIQGLADGESCYGVPAKHIYELLQGYTAALTSMNTEGDTNTTENATDNKKTDPTDLDALLEKIKVLDKKVGEPGDVGVDYTGAVSEQPQESVYKELEKILREIRNTREQIGTNSDESTADTLFGHMAKLLKGFPARVEANAYLHGASNAPNSEGIGAEVLLGATTSIRSHGYLGLGVLRMSNTGRDDFKEDPTVERVVPNPYDRDGAITADRELDTHSLAVVQEQNAPYIVIGGGYDVGEWSLGQPTLRLEVDGGVNLYLVDGDVARSTVTSTTPVALDENGEYVPIEGGDTKTSGSPAVADVDTNWFPTLYVRADALVRSITNVAGTFEAGLGADVAIPLLDLESPMLTPEKAYVVGFAGTYEAPIDSIGVGLRVRLGYDIESESFVPHLEVYVGQRGGGAE
jgi:hypothetical protein